MEPSKERYNELCRLCASYDAVKMDIFGNEGKNRQLVDKIQTCLPFKIAEDDRLPKCLCYRCMYNLENFYDFRTACVNAVALLERCLPPGNNATGKQIENGVESYSELRSELLKEKEKMPILIPEAPIVNPNAALGTPPRLNSDGEGEPEIEEIHNVSGTEDGVAKESVFATNASFEDTDDRKSDEYEMDMETNPSDFLEMTPMVTEEMDETSVKKSQASKTRNIIETFQHTSEQHEVYVCSLCNKAFSSKGHLSLHARIHVGAGDVIGAKVVTDDHTSYKRPYQCDLCNKSYSTAKHRWGHVSTTHRGHPAVTCAYCSRIYSTRTNLEEHIKSRHTGLPPPPELPVAYVQPDNRYRCKTCPKMYTNVTDLNKHTRVCAADVAIKEKQQQQQQQRPVKKIPRKNKSRVDTSDISSSSGTTDTEDESNNDYRNAEAKLSKNPQLTILKQALTKGGENLKRDYEDRRNQATAGGGDNKPPAAKVPRIENSEGPGRKRWYCEMCPQNFTSVEKLKQHEMIHDAERPYVCILCEKDFVLKTSLSRHIVSSHGVDPTPILESDKCTKKGALAQSWRKKLIKTEEVKGRCKREAPSDSSEDADSFAHGNMVEIETVFVCEICTRDFNDRASLWLHIRATHKEFAAFACGVCLKICSDNAQLLNHVNMYHGGSKLLVSEQRRYSCTICGRQHDSRKKLITHVSIHNVDPGYDPASFVQLNANYYNESFNSNEPNDHLMDFDPEDGDKVDCYICYKSFPNEDHLIRHQRNAHKSEGVAPSNQVTIPSNNGPASVAVPGLNGTKAQYHLFFVCELCGSSHPSKWERWLHVSGNHSEDPSMRCEREDCGKIFATKALRNEHAQHHLIQGSSPNTCEVCGKLWGSRVDYWKHVMGVHSDTVPLICGVCLKVFPDVAKLSSHVKTSHWPLTNGDFSCDICGRPYSNKSKMSRHRKIHGVVEVDPTLGNSGDTGGRATAAGDIRNETRAYYGEKSPKEVELTCELCTDMSFENWQSLCNHRRMIHGLFPCDLCNKCYGRTSHLWKHVNRVHKGHEDVTCRYCMKTSASKDHLMAHIAKIHRYEPENKLEMMMVVGEAAAAVVTTVTGEEEEEEEEENGDEEQETRKRRRRRKGGEASSLGMIGEDDEAGGGGSGVHHCDKCQKSFHKRYLLRRHMKGCQNYRKDPGALLTRCRACERIFKDRASLQKHIENHHSEYTCHLCNETVTSKLGIMTHNRVNHLHHPDLTCENGNCRKLFRTKEDLESHRKDHKYHNSPNVCDFCGDTVENKLKLKMHVLSLHRNEIGVSCGVCLIPMKDPKDLKKHVEDEHEGVLHKPNTCQVCGKRYASKWKAFDHTKKCHGKVFRTCKQCLAVFTTDVDIRHHYEHVHNVPKDQLAGFENRLLDSRTEDCDAIVKDEPEDYEYEVHRDGSTGVGLCDENEGFDFKRRKSSGGGGLGKNHRDTHDCEICPEIFLNRVTLSDHYRNVHNTDPERMYKRIKLERDEGGRFISSSATGSSKRMMMRERENFECQNCSRQFCTKSLFWNHTNVCTRRNSANRDDPRSSASFGQSSSILEAHLKNNNRIKKEPSDVPGLDETNLNIPDFNLFEDINMQLSEQKPIPNLMPLSELRRGGGVGGGSSTAGGLLLLPSSNEKSMRKDSRKDSRKVYDESTNTVCICEVCGKQWPAKKHLWQHLIRFHRAEAAVTCGVCLKLCTNYEQLGQHLRTTHESVLSREGNNFTCKTCGRYHNARSKLLLHMSIHINNDNGGATCWCPKCEKSFENEEKLHEHAPACDKNRPAIFEEHSIDIDTDREIKIEDDKGSLIGDGASLSGEDEEEVDFSDQRVRRNSENSVNSESSRGGARTHSDSDSSDEEDEDEDEEEEDSESRTNSRATGAATCHSETEEENDIREKSPVDIPPSISPEDAKSNSDNSKLTTNTPETKQEQKVAKDKEQADDGTEAPTQDQHENEQSPVSLTKNLETNGSSTVLEPIAQRDNDNVDDEDEDDDDGPPILSPMMPLSSENANQERDDLASHRLSPMLSLNENEEISAVPMATETTEAVKETNGTAESCSPKDQQFYEDDDCGERSNEELASDEEHEEETLEDENEELDDEDSRIHVVNPDDEYHSDDDRPPEDDNDQGGEEEEEEEEEEDEDEDDREEPGLENDGEDEEEQEQEEVEAEEEEEEERGTEENLEMHQEEEALEEVEEEEEMMEDDNDVVNAEEEEEEEEEEAEDEELTAENSLQIHNLDGTVLMVANDADGNQILIQRNVSDMENDESIGALTGYIYEDDDDEYDFTGFQVEDGGIEVEEARRVTGEDSEEEEEEEGDEAIILVPDEDEREIPEAENEKEPEQDYPDESNQEEMEVRTPAKNYDNDRVGQDPSAT